MAFWTDATNFDPKRDFTWQVTFGDQNLGNISFAAKTCTKPKFTQTEVTHNYLNYEFHYPGRVQHDTITVQVVNLAGDLDTAFAVSKLFQTAGYQIPGSANALSTIGKGAATRALKNFSIKQIDHEGNILEEWKLRNAWLKDFSFSDLDYSSDELSTVDMVFRYDFAELSSGESERETIFTPRT